MVMHYEIKYLKGKAAICGTRFLSVSRQVGAHLWHKGPAGVLSRIRTHNLLALMCVSRCRLYH